MKVRISAKRLLEATTMATSGLIVAIAVSWLVLHIANFSYGFWHDTAGIKEAIERFGPENKFKQGFELTDKVQRVRLFQEINNAIHDSGKGLEQITFDVEGAPPQTLLTKAEVIHLQDVANLIDFGMLVSAVAFVLWLGTIGYGVWSGRPQVGLGMQCLAIGLLLGIMSVITWVIGPVKVFYWMHEVIFPDNHQWFFYYQESLMSTMMFAPNLFGWIAIEWLVLSIGCFLILQWGTPKGVQWLVTKASLKRR